MPASIYEANLAVLQHRDPALAARLRNEPHDQRVVLRDTASGAPTLLLIQDGANALALHHPDDPMGYARQSLAQTQGIEAAQCLLVADCGLGYMPLAIREQGISRMLIYLLQPNLSILRAAMRAVDWRPLLTNPSTRVVVCDRPGVLSQALTAHLMDLAANPPLLIESPAIGGAFPQWRQEIIQVIRETLRFAQSGLMTKFKDGPLTLGNLLDNLDAVAATPGLSSLGDSLRNTPAIVVAAGPSLAKNIDQLRGIENEALLIATDTAFEPLRRVGARPHFVVTVDPTELNLRHFAQQNYSDETRLLFDPEARPEIVARFERRLTYLTDKHDFFAWLDRQLGGKGVIKKGGMVSQAGIQAAAFLGCSPIILVGQDLALDPAEGSTHHPDAALMRNVRFLHDDRDYIEAPSLADGTMTREPLYWVEGVDGNPVPTVQSFLIYIRLLEEDFRAMSVPVIDATEGGARIAGTEVLSLEETLRKYRRPGARVEQRLSQSLSNASARTPLAEELKRHLGDVMKTRLHQAEELERQAFSAPNEPLPSLEARLEQCRGKLFSDPVSEYLIEYAAPRELFEFLKRGPANAPPVEQKKQLLRRFDALTGAVRQAHIRLRDALSR